MKLVLVVAVLAIILASTTGINRNKFGRKTIGCRGDLNATAGCDKTCKRRCPGPTPVVCECPKKNSCMCRRPYVYDPTINKCVKLKDCAPPITEEDTTTEYITTTDEPTTEVKTTTEQDTTTTDSITTTDEPTTEIEKTTGEVTTTTDCITTTDESTTEVETTTNYDTTIDESTTEDDQTTTDCITTTDESTTEANTTTEVETTTDYITTSDESTTEVETTTDCITTSDESTTENETTTDCITTTDESTTEVETTTECIDTTDEPPTECIDTTDDTTTKSDDDCEDYSTEPVTTTMETITDCDDYDDTTTSQPITTTDSNGSSDKPCQCSCNCPGNEITTQEPTTTPECNDETTTEYYDETTTGCDDENTTECGDETNTECDDNATNECGDETTTGCDDENTTECGDETNTECDDNATTECGNETTTKCDDKTSTECYDETTTECNDKTTTECDDETTEAATTTEVTTTEVTPVLDECPEAWERFLIKLCSFSLKFLYSYAVTFPSQTFSGSTVAPLFPLMFLLKFAKGITFSQLSQGTGLNNTSEIVCICNKINKVIYSDLSAGLEGGVAIAVKSNYTFTSTAERFMKEVIVGDLIPNLSIDTMNEKISELTNGTINNVINNTDNSDQMVFLSGTSMDIMINSNKSIIKPFYEAPFKYAPCNFTIVRGMYDYADCPSIQAKLVRINSIEGNFSRIIVKPYAAFGLEQQLEKTNDENLLKCLRSMKRCLVNVEIPQITTNNTVNTLKLIKYANISSSITSNAEYKNMLVGDPQINLTKARQRTTLKIRSGEPLPPNPHDIHSIFKPSQSFIANTPHWQCITSPPLGDMIILCGVVASCAAGSQTIGLEG